MSGTIKQKLEQAADLERKHGVVSIHLAIPEGVEVTAGECVDHYIDLINTSVEMLKGGK